MTEHASGQRTRRSQAGRPTPRPSCGVSAWGSRVSPSLCRQPLAYLGWAGSVQDHQQSVLPFFLPYGWLLEVHGAEQSVPETALSTAGGRDHGQEGQEALIRGFPHMSIPPETPLLQADSQRRRPLPQFRRRTGVTGRVGGRVCAPSVGPAHGSLDFNSSPATVLTDLRIFIFIFF